MHPPLRILVALLLTVGTAGGSWWAGYRSAWFRYETLRIVGNAHLSESAVRHLASLEVGAPLASLDLDQAAAHLAAHPWVADVSVRRVFPNTVQVQLREREVRAVLAAGGVWLVDRDGTVFHRAEAGQLDHPWITGLPDDLVQREPALAQRIVQDALGCLDAAERVANLSSDRISEVRFDVRAGYTLALPNGGEILLGFRPPEEPLGQLMVLAKNGVSPDQRPLRIDLGTRTQAVVTPLDPPRL